MTTVVVNSPGVVVDPAAEEVGTGLLSGVVTGVVKIDDE